jgi:hypothetical protein
MIIHTFQFFLLKKDIIVMETKLIQVTDGVKINDKKIQQINENNKSETELTVSLNTLMDKPIKRIVLPGKTKLIQFIFEVFNEDELYVYEINSFKTYILKMIQMKLKHTSGKDEFLYKYSCDTERNELSYSINCISKFLKNIKLNVLIWMKYDTKNKDIDKQLLLYCRQLNIASSFDYVFDAYLSVYFDDKKYKKKRNINDEYLFIYFGKSLLCAYYFWKDYAGYNNYNKYIKDIKIFETLLSSINFKWNTCEYFIHMYENICYKINKLDKYELYSDSILLLNDMTKKYIKNID